MDEEALRQQLEYLDPQDLEIMVQMWAHNRMTTVAKNLALPMGLVRQRYHTVKRDPRFPEALSQTFKHLDEARITFR